MSSINRTGRRAIGRVSLAIAVIVVVVVAAVAGVTLYRSVPTTSSTTSSLMTSLTSTGSVDPNPKVLTYEVEGTRQWESLDPATDNEGNLQRQVYENLMFYESNSTLASPWLAQSYTVSPDGMTYTFHLRQGITFTDGTPLNSTAVWFSMMRSMLIDDPSSDSWVINSIVRGGQNYSAAYNGDGKYSQADVNALLAAKPVECNCAPWDNDTSFDPYTVVIHISTPFTPFLTIMATEATSIISPSGVIPHWTSPSNASRGYVWGITAGDYRSEENPWTTTHMDGTGPYELASFNEATTTVTFQKNPAYWGGPNGDIHPSFQNVIVRLVADSNTRLLDLKSGVADIIDLDPNDPLVFQLVDRNTWLTTSQIENTYPGIEVHGPFSNLGTTVMPMNLNILTASGQPAAFQPFQDIRIRQALAMLFNTTDFSTRVFNGFSPAATQPIPVGMFGYDTSIGPVMYNPSQAEQLLIQAGTNPIIPGNAFSPSNPQTITILYSGTGYQDVAATILAAAVNNIASVTGLHMSPEQMPFPQKVALEDTHQIQMWVGEWSADYNDPTDFLLVFGNHGGFYPAHTGFRNDTIDAWVAQEMIELNSTARIQLIDKIETAIAAQYLYIWLTSETVITASRTWIQDVPNATVFSNIKGDYNPIYVGWAYYASVEPVT